MEYIKFFTLKSVASNAKFWQKAIENIFNASFATPTLFFLSLFFICFISAHSNLEKMAQDYVLETKKIDIPGHPTAFNPSIVRWNGSILMSFRTRDPITASTHLVGFVEVDEDFNLVSEPRFLDISEVNPYLPEKLQDVRLIAIKGDLYIVYNNVVGPIEFEMRRMFMAKLQIEQDRFYLGNIESILDFEGASSSVPEKNWVPFEFKGEMMLAYSIQPHLIFQPMLGTSTCKTIAATNGKMRWEWGQMRGGTPALLTGEEYLAFFHSSKEMVTAHSDGKKISHYFMGAYTFASKPPFNITKVSPEPIIASNFYSGAKYNTWKPLRVIFPCGYIMDTNFIWIAYGKQDHELWVVKLDKQGLYNSLVPVNIDLEFSSKAQRLRE